MHTDFSTDSEASVKSMLDASVERGLRTVCITDHLDLDYPEDEELGPEPFQLDLKEYFKMLTKVREEYRGKPECANRSRTWPAASPWKRV